MRFLAFLSAAFLLAVSSASGQADALKVGPDHKLKPPNDAPTFFGSNQYIWTAGATSDGYHLVGGYTEAWNGAEARLTLQGYGSEHGLIVHTTGMQGMAIIGWSSTGAQALKAIQDTYFDSSALTVVRRGTTASSDDAAVIVASTAGLADLARFVGSGGTSTIDQNAAVHPPHLADVTALADSVYFSTTQSKLCYKDMAGGIHPLY